MLLQIGSEMIEFPGTVIQFREWYGIRWAKRDGGMIGVGLGCLC